MSRKLTPCFHFKIALLLATMLTYNNKPVECAKRKGQDPTTPAKSQTSNSSSSAQESTASKKTPAGKKPTIPKFPTEEMADIMRQYMWDCQKTKSPMHDFGLYVGKSEGSLPDGPSISTLEYPLSRMFQHHTDGYVRPGDIKVAIFSHICNFPKAQGQV